MTNEAQRIEDIAACRRNLDSMSRDDAARNLMDDKPAYWSMAGGSALGLSAQVAATANFQGSLIRALDEKSEGFAARGINIARDILDKLIPLNIDAVEELDLCYRHQSTFRARESLLGRETSAILNPWSPAFPNDDSEAVAERYSALVAEARQRLNDRRNAALHPEMIAAE